MSHASMEERSAFLRDVHVGVLAVEHDGESPLAVPIWYSFENELISVHSARTDLKTRLLLSAGRFTLCVQTEVTPYRYVSMEGSIVAVEEVSAEERTTMVHRYLDPDMANAYQSDGELMDSQIKWVLESKRRSLTVVPLNSLVDKLSLRVLGTRW